jgi:hypothetical protein
MTFNYLLPLLNTRSLPPADWLFDLPHFSEPLLRRLVHSPVFPGRGATRWNIALHLVIKKRYVLLSEPPIQCRPLYAAKRITITRGA